MIKSISIALTTLMLSSGCSTIVSSEHEEIEVTSKIPGQAFEVKDFNGFTIAKGVTPAKVSLTNYGDSSFEYVTPCDSRLEDSAVNKSTFFNVIGWVGFAVDFLNGYINTPQTDVTLTNCDKALVNNEKGI